MPLQQVNASGLTAEIRDSYDKTMLYVARPELIHAKYGRAKRIPKGEGRTVHWRRYALLPPATVPLTEGVTPAGNSLTIQEVVVTVQQYGDFVPFTDVVTVVSIDPLMVENAEILGQQAGNTLDIITRDAINSGTNIRYANAKVSRGTVAAGDIITDAEIKKMRRTLKRQNVKPATGGSYVAIVHPDTMIDVMSTDAWKLPGYYQDKSQIDDGTVRSLYGVMFLETTNAKVFTGQGQGGIDVYATVCFGMEAFAYVDLQDLGLETIYKALGSAGTDDPLNQRQTQAWKATYAAKILNDNYLVRLEHAVSN